MQPCACDVNILVESLESSIERPAALESDALGWPSTDWDIA